MAEIGMLWIGDPLSKIELISLNSFLYHGHNVTVYLYDQSIQLPKNVKKADANLILPENKVFRMHYTYATFADLFRYHMIKKTGKIWSDMDNICLSSDLNFNSTVYASNIGSMVSNSILYIDQESEILDYLIENAEKIYDILLEENVNYRVIGSILLTEAIRKFNLMNDILPEHILLGLPYGEENKLFMQTDINKVLNKESKIVSIFNSNFRNRESEKDIIPTGSLIEYFYNKFVLGVNNG